MTIKKLYTLITVQSFAGLRDYYCGHFGLSVTMEAPGYLHFSGPGGAELAFMTQDADAPEVFDGKGLLICLEVADVDAKAAQLEKARVPQIAPLRDNPWGDRSVIVRDPVGTHVYVFQAKSTAK